MLSNQYCVHFYFQFVDRKLQLFARQKASKSVLRHTSSDDDSLTGTVALGVVERVVEVVLEDEGEVVMVEVRECLPYPRLHVQVYAEVDVSAGTKQIHKQ